MHGLDHASATDADLAEALASFFRHSPEAIAAHLRAEGITLNSIVVLADGRECTEINQLREIVNGWVS